jgi:hypothetical protein
LLHILRSACIAFDIAVPLPDSYTNTTAAPETKLKPLGRRSRVNDTERTGPAKLDPR